MALDRKSPPHADEGDLGGDNPTKREGTSSSLDPLTRKDQHLQKKSRPQAALPSTKADDNGTRPKKSPYVVEGDLGGDFPVKNRYRMSNDLSIFEATS